MKRPLATVTLLVLLGALSGCTGTTVGAKNTAKSGSTPLATAPVTPSSSPSPTSTSSVPEVLGVSSVHRLLAALPTPSRGSGTGFTYHFNPAVLTGSSSFGDFGSAEWNVDYTSSRGNGTWAAQLYVFKKASEASFTLAHSTAAQQLCSSKPTTVSGFVAPTAHTVAVACQGTGSRPGWWVIVDRADQQTWFVMATNSPARDLATAAARSIVGSLGPTVAQAEVALHKLSLPS